MEVCSHFIGNRIIHFHFFLSSVMLENNGFEKMNFLNDVMNNESSTVKGIIRTGSETVGRKLNRSPFCFCQREFSFLAFWKIFCRNGLIVSCFPIIVEINVTNILVLTCPMYLHLR